MDAYHHLALLLAAPHAGEEAMLADQAAMTAALCAQDSAGKGLLIHSVLDSMVNRPIIVLSIVC